MDTLSAPRTTTSLLDRLQASADWGDWRWQLRHSIRSIDALEHSLGIRIEARERARLELTIEKFPLAITPHYLSLVNRESLFHDPVFRQCFPSARELEIGRYEHADPLAEDSDSPVPLLTHRYPDRVLLHIANRCAMYCRHCTRKRKVGDSELDPSDSDFERAVDYLRKTTAVRDVLLSGGDPLMLSDQRLDRILTALRDIPHIEIIRIGSRVPVVLPQRVTPALVEVLRRHHPLWLNTHFNHPQELGPDARQALAMLANAGIPLGNQSVLLAGVNDCPKIMRRLVQDLVRNRVRPYYLYQCDLSEGLTHFRTRVGKGIEIIESLVGHTSGFAVPTYVIDAPGGGGKIPVMPNYLVSWSTNKVVLRNYEGVITSYQEPESYREPRCSAPCADCALQIDDDAWSDCQSIGIARILDDGDDLTTLVPEGCDRLARREDSHD